MGHCKPFGSVNKIKTIGGDMRMLSDGLCNHDVHTSVLTSKRATRRNCAERVIIACT